MKDKICFSRTLLILVLIGAAIVVGFMAMKTNFSSSTKAAGFVGSSCAVKDYCDVYQFNGKYLQTGLICTERNGVKTLQIDTGTTCTQEICLYNQINVLDPSNPKYSYQDTSTDDSIYCIVDKRGATFINQGATCVKGFYRSQYAKVACAAAAPAAITCPSTGYKLFGSTCYNMGSKIFNAGTANQYCGNQVADLAKCTPAAITCPSTAFKMFGNSCYSMGSKLFNAGTANQYCGNEVTALAACTPATITCTSTGYKMFGSKCYSMASKLFNAGTANQYCGNQEAAMSNCTPSAITCTSTGYKMFGSKCYSMASKLFNAGTANQYCGNQEAAMSNCTPSAITCTSTGYGVSNGYCYKLGSKLFNAGTANQYCANERMNNFNCCNDPSAAGC